MFAARSVHRLGIAVVTTALLAAGCSAGTSGDSPGTLPPVGTVDPTPSASTTNGPAERAEGDAIVLLSGELGTGSTVTIVSVETKSPVATYRYPDIAVHQWHSFSPGYDRRAMVGGERCVGDCIGMTAAGYLDGATGEFHAVTPEVTGFGPRPYYRDAVYVGDRIAAVRNGEALVLADSGEPVPGYPTDFIPRPGQRLVSSPLGFIASVDTEPQGYSVPNCVPDPLTRTQICLVPTAGPSYRLTVGANGQSDEWFGDELPIDVELLWVNRDGSVLFTERTTGHRTLFVMPRVEGGPRRALTPETDYLILGAATAPDDARIAFTAVRGGAPPELFLVDSHGGEPVRLLGDLPAHARVIDWT